MRLKQTNIFFVYQTETIPHSFQRRIDSLHLTVLANVIFRTLLPSLPAFKDLEIALIKMSYLLHPYCLNILFCNHFIILLYGTEARCTYFAIDIMTTHVMIQIGKCDSYYSPWVLSDIIEVSTHFRTYNLQHSDI